MEGVSKRQSLELATCQFVEQPAEVAIPGPIRHWQSRIWPSLSASKLPGGAFGCCS